MILAEDQHRISNIDVVEYCLHGGFRCVYAAVGAAVHIVVRAVVFTPGGVVESVWAINSDPVLYKHEIIRAGQPAIRVLIFNMIEARGGLMTVEGAGDDAGVDDALGILVHGHGLIVNIYLDISAGNGEFFAISGTIDRRIEVGEVERKELGGEGLKQGRAVDGVIDLQEGNRNFFAGISGENICLLYTSPSPRDRG